MRYSDQQDKKSENISRNEKFLRKVRESVESNLGNERFGVENLAETMAFSRSYLYRKLYKLTGKNISQYIREIRLERAMELLRNNTANVAEIAYQVGFGSPSYFNKCFHDHFGFPPGEVLKIQEEKELGLNAGPEKPENESRKNILFGKGKINKSGRRWMIIIFIIIICSLSFYLINQKSIFSQKKKQITVGVVPLWNVSPDNGDDFLCKSIEEEIRFQLKDITPLIILPGESVERYRNDPEIDYKLIGKNLKATFLVGGSFRKSNNYVRIEVQLIDAKTGNIFWSKTYDGFYSEKIYDLQRTLARRIAESLNATIESREKIQENQKVTDNQAALDLFWKANRHIRRYECYGDNHELIMADKLLNQIPKIDQYNSPYLGGRAHVCWLKGDFDSSMYFCNRLIKKNPEKRGGYGLKGILLGLFMNQPGQAIPLIQKNIDLDPGSPWGYLAMGQIYQWTLEDPVKGLIHYQKAYNSMGNMYPEINSQIGQAFCQIGAYDKAEKYYLEAIRKAELEIPECRWILRITDILLSLGKFERTHQFLDSICNISECTRECNKARFDVFLYQRDYKKALDIFNTLIQSGEIIDYRDSVTLAFIYKKLGREKEATTIIKECKASIENRLPVSLENQSGARKNYLDRYGKYDLYDFYNKLTSIHLMLSEDKEALKYFIKSTEFKTMFTSFDLLEKNPEFENLTNKPEFKAFIKKDREETKALRDKLSEMVELGELNL